MKNKLILIYYIYRYNFQKYKNQLVFQDNLLIKNINTNPIYNRYKAEQSKGNYNSLSELLGNNSERYFYLPKTPFIDNSLVDFQEKIMVNYEELDKSFRFTKLDTPYAQSMITNFIRYYNRIGFPDIDKEYVISKL